MTTFVDGGRGTRGRVTAEAVVLPDTFTFFGGVDWDSGRLFVPSSELDGVSIAGRAFIFTMPAGGQGTAWKISEMVEKGTAPVGIAVHRANSVLLSGCVLARIPLVGDLDEDPTAHFCTGDIVTIDSDEGSVARAE